MKNGRELMGRGRGIKEWGIMSKRKKIFQESKARKMKDEEEKRDKGSLNHSFSGSKRMFGSALMTPNRKSRGEKVLVPSQLSMAPYSGLSQTTKRLDQREKSTGKLLDINNEHTKDQEDKTSSQQVDIDLSQTKGLCAESLKKETLKKGRGGLANSLIGFSLEDIKNVHKVKSEYNSKTVSKNSIGKMFACLDGSTTVGGMVSNEYSNKEDNEDVRSSSALSFMSGNAMFSPFGRSISGFPLKRFG